MDNRIFCRIAKSYSRSILTCLILCFVLLPGCAEKNPGNGPISIIGNSHAVNLDEYISRMNITDMVAHDTDPNNTHKTKNCAPNLCYTSESCDKFTVCGRHLDGIRLDTYYILDEMDKINSSAAVIIEGTNSISVVFDRQQVRQELESIVKVMHSSGKRVYFAEIPFGVINAAGNDMPNSVTYPEYKVLGYNSLIREVGADGVVEFGNIPWKSGNLHGYELGTFGAMVERIREAVN